MEHKKKVLCVDDEPVNLLILAKILGKDYEVIKANSGPKALQALESDSSIELVITDMRMPGMSGLEFIHEANKRYTDKKFFMLSGFAIDEEIQEALDSNLICAYFQKPANFQLIQQTLAAYS